MTVDYKHACRLQIKYCLEVNNHKHGEGTKFLDYSQQILRRKRLYVILSYRFFQKKNEMIR
jgi:hypothetical protein